MRYIPGGYQVEAGHAFAGAVVTMTKNPWHVISVRPKWRLGAIALALLALVAWRLRSQLPKAFAGLLTGMTVGIPLGLAVGLVHQFGFVHPQYHYFVGGNIAVDLAILSAGLGSVAGISVQLLFACRRFLRLPPGTPDQQRQGGGVIRR